MDAWMWFGVGALVGAVGTAAVFLRRRGQIQAELASARNRADMLDQQLVAGEKAEARLKDTFAALSAQALKGTSEQFLTLAETKFKEILSGARGDFKIKHDAIDNLVKPIKELLENQKKAVNELELKRVDAYAKLNEQIKTMTSTQVELRQEAGRLVSALRRPKTRGDWGEFQLENVVQLAGMEKYCDYEVQPSTDDPESRKRPDMIVRMPGGGTIIIDSKVVLENYLNVAMNPEADREAELAKHAHSMQERVKELAKKRYQSEYDTSPDFVVMFVRIEAALIAALDQKPDLIESAMQQNILIVTPILLLALLQSAAYGWRHEDIQRNVKEIADTGDKLYQSISRFVDAYVTVGKRIGDAAKSYDKSIGTLETHLLSNARKLRELSASTEKEIEDVPAIGQEMREVVKPELLSLPDDTE